MISKLISEVFGHTDPADITKGGQCMANTNGNPISAFMSISLRIARTCRCGI